MPEVFVFSESERAFVSKAEQYCVQGEQCRSAVFDKLKAWGADEELAQKVTDYLEEEGFIDERRYCRLYCESKLRLQKWGRVKIAYNLRMKRIGNELIEEALRELDEEQYFDTLRQLAESKRRSLHESDPRKLNAKLVSFLASHGFTMNEILECLNA